MFNLLPFYRNERNSLLNLERSLFGDFFIDILNSRDVFKTNIKENDKEYILEAELPGFSKGDIQIEIKDDILNIKAQHKEDKEDNTNDFLRRERYCGIFQRSFHIPNINEDKINAEYNNGILKLTLPKNEQTKSNTKKIEIK